MTTLHARNTVRTLLAAALGAAMLIPAGCNYLAPAVILLTPPPSRDAQFTLDKQRVAVVFIDDPQNKAPRRSLRAIMGQTAEQTLIAKGVMPSNMLIPSQTAMQLTSRESDSNKFSIVDVGRTLGADVVIYAKLEGFGLSTDGVTLKPYAVAQVRVLDAANNMRLWPEAGTDYPVVYEGPQQAGETPGMGTARAEAERKLAERLGLEIARVFFKHEIERESPSGFN
ncbi:MAG: hypothetical protein ACTS27_03245 [Phycisphaerales bacterium]